MTSDVSPILDRYTQEALGRMLRERLDDARDAGSSAELDALLESLRQAGRSRDAGMAVRN